MTELSKVTAGVAAYIDDEIIPKVNGWQRWIFSAAVTAYLAKAPEMLEQAKGISIVSDLALIDKSNRIDVDKVYKYIRPEAEKNTATIKLPLLGTIMINVDDVDKLYNCIKEQ